MKRLFGHRSGGSFPGTTPVPQPTPTGPNYEPAITFSETPPLSEMSASGLRHLIPDDSMDGEPDFAGTENPISLRDLFDFNDDGWVNIYDGYARKRLTEELELCELLNRDSETGEGMEVDVDDMTGEILMA